MTATTLAAGRPGFMRRLAGIVALLTFCVGASAHGEDRAQRLAGQRSLAARQAVKISVRHSGWYHVGQPQLVAAGLPPNTNPQNLRLFADGIEQPLRIIGKATGRFESGDAIEFYGTGLDTPFTDTHVYWLIADTPGARVPVQDGRTNAPASAHSFPFTVEKRDRNLYFAALKNNGGNKFFGDVLGSWGPVDEAVVLKNLDRTSSALARVEIALQGVTDDPTVDPDHRVGVLVNGTEVGQLEFDRQNEGIKSFDVSQSLLTSGDNTISLITRGGDFDMTIFNYLRVTYWRPYTAENDALRFSAEAQRPVSVDGFSTGDIRLVDVTDPGSPRELTGTVRRQGSGFQISAIPQGAGARTVLAFTATTMDSPDAVRANSPSNVSASQNDADYVIVTHHDFIDAMQPLKALRESEGHRALVVDVEDLYDEFSFGEKTPQAIKDFVVRANAQWRTAPRFLVLVGNATNDPRKYGTDETDYVPVQLVSTSALEVPADDWFADVDGDGRPELASVGRLPARSVAQAAAMVAKLRAYAGGADGTWSRNVLLVADENDQDDDFEGATGAVASLLPSQYQANSVFRGRLGTEIARSEMLQRIDEGQLLVNYFGHGSVDIWRDELLKGSDAPAMANGSRLPLVVAMTCLNGFFHTLFPEESLAEALVRAPNGGAIAVWASSTLTSQSAQLAMDRELFRLLFSGAYKTVGEAVVGAKKAAGDTDVRRSWILFGDPATQLKGLPDAPVTTDATLPSSPSRRDVAVMPQAQTVRAESSLTESTAGHDGHPAVASAVEPSWQIFSADVNADRLSDVLLYQPETGAWREGLNHGDGTFDYRNGRWPANVIVRPVDLDRDGRADVFLYDRQTGGWLGAISDGLGGFTYQRGVWAAGWNIEFADFNGDRFVDLLLYDPATGARQLGLNNGAGGFTPLNAATSKESKDSTIHVGDFNGDWYADLLSYDPTTGEWKEGLGDGVGHFTYSRGVLSAKQQLNVADFDGDGRADMLLYDPSNGRWTVGISRTTGVFAFTSGTWASGWTVTAGDLNDDGRADVLLYEPTTGQSSRCLAVANKSGEFKCAGDALAAGGGPATRPGR
jgi:hypothetical protein